MSYIVVIMRKYPTQFDHYRSSRLSFEHSMLCSDVNSKIKKMCSLGDDSYIRLSTLHVVGRCMLLAI